MPVVAANKKLMSMYGERISRLGPRELKAYVKALEEFMDITSSPVIAQTLKECYAELEWRGAAHPKR